MPLPHDTRSPGRIALLDERVRNQIAAGEVVERPASVVKELVENALDSGARTIDVDLLEGGTRLVRVTDDGSGMPRADVELAFVAHATSKLSDVGDLDHIATLGFRGEALASIGAVARCKLVSREPDSELGWSIECEGGQLGPATEAGSSVGTRIEVRDLFFNVPARRRFLKQTATELARCLDFLQRAALAHTGVAFRVTHDTRRVLDVEADMDLRARIRRAFGAELADALVPVDARDGRVRLSGFVAPPRFARGDTGRQMWFLNGRSVRDKVLLRALKEGYRGFVFESRQPVAFLNLALDPAAVDVNVHPQKTEVRFRDERTLVGFLIHALREAVRAGDLATPGARLVDMAQQREAREERFVFPAHTREREDFRVHEVVPMAPLSGSARVEAVNVGERAPERGQSAHAGISGSGLLQVAATYIVRPIGDGFEIVDQHALHERITYEALKLELLRGAIEVQRLLVPELVEAARHEVAAITARAADLARAGIEIAAFGDTTIVVQALPARLQRARPALIVRDVLDLLEREAHLAPERLLEEVLHRAACRSSVMAGDVLSEDEMRALLERGRELESDQTCVHGRPTRVRFALADLERAFDRR